MDNHQYDYNLYLPSITFTIFLQVAKTVLKTRLIYVISNLDNSLGFEWLAEETDYTKYDVTYIFLNPSVSPLMKKFGEKGIRVKHVQLKGKKDLFAATVKLIVHFLRMRPHVVHAHLFEGSLTGMCAAWICGVKKRIHTRHHSTLHHVEHPSVVKYDRLVNFFSTKIVAVTENVAEVLEKEGVSRSRITVIHHGFRLERFYAENISAERISRLQSAYNPGSGRPVIGVISRFVEWKGIQYIIPAFEKLLQSYPQALLILANSSGNFSTQINSMLAALPPGSCRAIKFENDIFALYRLFDVFVHIPVRKDAEAFGQIYIEAMAAGVCMVCTHSGVSPEVVKDNFNAMVVPYRNSDAVYEAMKELISNPSKAGIMRKNAMQSVTEDFSVKGMINRLEELYG
jgi:glycosyltransferase involved in cell wall biosynthesis